MPADQPPQEEAANTSSEAAKPRILKRPVKPDEAEYKKQMDALVEQIKRHRDRSDEISRILSGKRTGNETPETKALRTKLSTLRAEWQTTLVRGLVGDMYIALTTAAASSLLQRNPECPV